MTPVWRTTGVITDPARQKKRGVAVATPLQPGGVDRVASTRGLSAREIEVLRLVAAGWSNGEIADRLFITRKTAGVHVTHILDKLGVSNRVEAAMAAARLGLVSSDEDDGDERPERRS